MNAIELSSTVCGENVHFARQSSSRAVIGDIDNALSRLPENISSLDHQQRRRDRNPIWASDWTSLAPLAKDMPSRDKIEPLLIPFSDEESYQNSAIRADVLAEMHHISPTRLIAEPSKHRDLYRKNMLNEQNGYYQKVVADFWIKPLSTEELDRAMSHIMADIIVPGYQYHLNHKDRHIFAQREGYFNFYNGRPRNIEATGLAMYFDPDFTKEEAEGYIAWISRAIALTQFRANEKDVDLALRENIPSTAVRQAFENAGWTIRSGVLENQALFHDNGVTARTRFNKFGSVHDVELTLSDEANAEDARYFKLFVNIVLAAYSKNDPFLHVDSDYKFIQQHPLATRSPMEFDRAKLSEILTYLGASCFGPKTKHL